MHFCQTLGKPLRHRFADFPDGINDGITQHDNPVMLRDNTNRGFLKYGGLPIVDCGKATAGPSTRFTRSDG
jgi:hypothetical protein